MLWLICFACSKEPSHCILETPKQVVLVNSKDPDEMQHDASFYQCMYCLLRLKHLSGTEIHHCLDISTCDPLQHIMGSLILIISICMDKSIRIQGDN